MCDSRWKVKCDTGNVDEDKAHVVGAMHNIT